MCCGLQQVGPAVPAQSPLQRERLLQSIGKDHFPFLLLVVEVRVAPEDGKVCMGQRAARAVNGSPSPCSPSWAQLDIIYCSIWCVDIYLVSGV